MLTINTPVIVTSLIFCECFPETCSDVVHDFDSIANSLISSYKNKSVSGEFVNFNFRNYEALF